MYVTKVAGLVLGKVMMSASRRRRIIASENVRRALPHLSAQEVHAVVSASYTNLGISLSELLCTPFLSKSTLESRVRIPGFEQVVHRHKMGLPTILLSAHYGNWEWLAMVAGLKLNAPVTIVAHPQSSSIANGVINRIRARYGNTIVPMGEAARPLIRTILGGGTVAFLVDQYAQWDKDPWISFFGRETPTFQAPAALALRTQTPIFHAYAERLPNGHYNAPIEEIPMDDCENTPEGIRKLTTRHVRLLEQQIRTRPELWSWQHRRWRDETAPPAPLHEDTQR